MSLNQTFITGYQTGLMTNKKPMLLPDQAWARLYNAYVWRERVLKREGIELVGRLQRNFSSINFFLSGTSPWTFNILVVSGYVSAANNANPGKITTTYPHGLTTGDKVIITGIVGATGYNNTTFTITVVDALNFTVGVNAGGFGAYVSGGFWISNRSLSATEPNAEIVPGSIIIVFGGVTFIDNGDGTLSSVTMGNSGHVNYQTGSVTLTTTVAANTATVLSYDYYPTLPAMGAPIFETPTLNQFQTIFFDQKYAYSWNGTNFSEFIPGTTWTGSNSQFFWGYNYRGSAPQNLLLFVTNFNSGDPMYYTDGNTWTSFAPLITSSQTLFQARILIAYYGRLLSLNTLEGSTMSGAGSAVNITNRCRFSAANASPISSNAWRTDIFGQGGVIDAPTSEAITGATFIKNTLVVDFETTTWQLRYVGEYGLPFVWERVSADLGSPCTFSGVLFDNFRLAVGDVAITAANSIGVDRIDLDIPDQVFQISDDNNGVKRVFGIRDYQKEVVYWNFPDAQTQAAPGTATIFPNRVFLYNYRNKTWAIFRDNITMFSTLEATSDTTWNSTSITWDDEETTWDDFDLKDNFPYIVSGNQQGFIHYYGYKTIDDASLTVYSINLTTVPIQIVSPNHNLANLEIIQLNGLLFLDSSTFAPLTSSLNEGIFAVQVIDANTFSISLWNSNTQTYEQNFPFTPVTTAIYAGGGTITLFPKLDVQTKDFNIYAQKGLQTKLSSIDFLMQCTNSAAMTVNIFTNAAAFPINANISIWSNEMQTFPAIGFNQPSAQYAWFKFVATASGQYFSINLTYDDNLMNTLNTHQETWILYGINAYSRPAGRMVT